MIVTCVSCSWTFGTYKESGSDLDVQPPLSNATLSFKHTLPTTNLLRSLEDL